MQRALNSQKSRCDNHWRFPILNDYGEEVTASFGICSSLRQYNEPAFNRDLARLWVKARPRPRSVPLPATHLRRDAQEGGWTTSKLPPKLTIP